MGQALSSYKQCRGAKLDKDASSFQNSPRLTQRRLQDESPCIPARINSQGITYFPPPGQTFIRRILYSNRRFLAKECWKFFLPSLKLARQDPPRDITTSKKNEKHDFTFHWCGIRWIKPRVLSLITGRQRPTRIYNLSANPSIPPRLVSTSSLIYSNQIGNIHWLVIHINNEIASTRFYLYKEL